MKHMTLYINSYISGLLGSWVTAGRPRGSRGLPASGRPEWVVPRPDNRRGTSLAIVLRGKIRTVVHSPNSIVIGDIAPNYLTFGKEFPTVANAPGALIETIQLPIRLVVSIGFAIRAIKAVSIILHACLASPFGRIKHRFSGWRLAIRVYHCLFFVIFVLFIIFAAILIVWTGSQLRSRAHLLFLYVPPVISRRHARSEILALITS